MIGRIVTFYRSAYAGLPRAAWLMSGVQLINMSGTMVIFFLSLYLTRKLGFSVSQAGQVISGYGFGMLLGTVTSGYLTDRLGAHSVQKISLACSGIFLIILGFQHSFTLVLMLVALYGFSNSALFPANASAMAAICSGELRIKGFVMNRLANNLGASIGPVVGGFLALLNYRLLFWVDGITCLLAADAFVLVFPEARPIPHTEPHQGNGPAIAWWRDGPFLTMLT